MNDNYENELMIQVFPVGDSKEWFLRLKETMTRIGIPKFSSTGKHKLFQSMFILRRKDKYILPHFKEMFILDGRTNNMTQDDYDRRNTIVIMLIKWGIIEVTSETLDMIYHQTPSLKNEPTDMFKNIFVLQHHKKHMFDLIQKYPIGIMKNKRYHQNKKIV